MKTLALIVLFCLLVPAFGVWAGDDFDDSWSEDETRQNRSSDWGEFDEEVRLEPAWQVGIGIALRQDNKSELSAQPEFSIKLYHFPIDNVAFTGEMGYTYRTSIGANTDARTYQFAFGIRAQGAPRLFSFYVEPALALQMNSVDHQSYTEATARIGIRATIGFTIRVSDGSHLDFGLRQSLNNFGMTADRDVLTPPLPEPPDDFPPYPIDGYVGGGYFNELFNPGYIFLRYRFSI